MRTTPTTSLRQKLPLIGLFSLIALMSSGVFLFPVFVGESGPESFSVCEEADDGGGEPRPECQASDVRYQAADPVDSDFGFALAMGDLNGDGLLDIAAGDPIRNRVYVFFGRTSSTAAYGLMEDLLDREAIAESTADVILEPAPGVGSFGFSVAIGQLVDATCAPDDQAAALLIGAPGNPGTTSNAPGTVFHIPAGGLCQIPVDPATPLIVDPLFIGESFQSPLAENDDEFGYAVALGTILSPGGDGDDIIIGARGAASGNGRVSIFPVTGGIVDLTPAADVHIEGQTGDGLGEVLAVGDLDQDFDEDDEPRGDRDDLAAGAVGHENGKVVLAQGPLAADGSVGSDGVYSEDPDLEIQSIVGEEAGDFFGFSVAISREGALAAGAIFADNRPPTCEDSGESCLEDNDCPDIGELCILDRQPTNINRKCKGGREDATPCASDADCPEGGFCDLSVRLNAGKGYIWYPGDLYGSGAPDPDAANARVAIVARRSGDQLGFGLAWGDLDASGEDDLILTARREDGTGIDINHIDQGTAYIRFDPTTNINTENEGATPIDLNDCLTTSDCTGTGAIDVMIFGGDRADGTGDELGFAIATGNYNGDDSDDFILSSRTHDRVYLVTLDDTDDDRVDFGRNIRDDDDDGDGDLDSVDCDPTDPLINSGADEITCNDIDENCNGMADDTPDEDGDGFSACGDDEAEIDCDDADADTYPGAPELCDGNDNDCDGGGEEDVDGDGYVSCTDWNDTQGDDPDILGGGDCDSLDVRTFPGAAPNEPNPGECRRDSDEDGFGDDDPPLLVTPGSDCNDASSFTFPGAAENESLVDCMRDQDEDGYGDITAISPIISGTDCADFDENTFPGAPELCDGNDNACAGNVPDDELDTDADGYVACSGWDDTQNDDSPQIRGGGDCDPNQPDTFPGAAPNEAFAAGCMRDLDGDDYGDISPPLGVTPGTDCNDLSIVTFPGAAPQDNAFSCMKDADGDDYGDEVASLPVVAGSDCDDTDALTFFGASEVADDGIDQDCNGFDAVSCFVDSDRDGFGGTGQVLAPDGSCDTAQGESESSDDCNDADASVSPGATETPDDGIDQDCNGADTVTCIIDADRDGAGNLAGATLLAPDGTCDAVDGEATTATDCNDADASTFPGAPQVCDGNDNTCAGSIPGNETDLDGDGYVACSGWNDTQRDNSGITGGGDCDETAADTHPGAGANEIFVSACMKDSDSDGYGDSVPPAGVTAGTDCNDNSGDTFPGAAAIDGPFNCMKDSDGDNYGDSGTTLPVVAGSDCDDNSVAASRTFPGAAVQDSTTACMKDLDSDGYGDDTPGAGVTAGTDCDDDSSAGSVTFPGATEICDGNDNSCSGSVPLDEQDTDGDFWVACNNWNDSQGDDPGILGGSDCDPADGSTFPGAAPNETQAAACMKDSDSDDFGDLSPANPAVTPGTDCDDNSPTAADTFPGAATMDGPLNCMKDSDGDEYGDISVSLPIVPGLDCDDLDLDAFPGAPEIPNDAIDQDCDGSDSMTCFEDLDGDGFGTSTTIVPDDMDCTDPGESPFDTDCDDGSASVFPNATEVPGDGIDQDCNSQDSALCFVDADGDTYGVSATLLSDDPDCFDNGESDVDTDCNDGDAASFPGAAEVPDDGLDQDCSGTDTVTCFVDADGDGFGTVVGTTVLADDGSCDTAQGEAPAPDDCEDTDSDIFPGATEIPDNGIDEDCNGPDAVTCVVDADGDGFGTVLGTPAIAGDGSCDSADGESTTSDDCDDADAGRSPGTPEIPGDGIDQDCSGADSLDCFLDADEDGFGNTLGLTVPSTDNDCADLGESSVDTDCVDTDNTVFPGAPEVPDDGIDQNCNNIDTISCFLDADEDGFGTSQGTIVLADDGVCDTADRESTTSDDCDDADPGRAPGVLEVVDDGIDQDCNGSDSITCIVDSDRDGFGTDSGANVIARDGSCDATQGESDTADDCDDTDPGRSPGAADIPGDGIDQNCDGFDSLDCFVDADGDGFGSSGTMLSADADCEDAGESSVDTDCDDTDETIFPGAQDTPDDAIDQNCNGSDTKTCIVDADQDGFGTDQGTTLLAPDGTCDTGQGESESSDDCNDSRALTFPGASEVADDGVDQDCNGFDTITCFLDADQDGFGKPASPVLAADGACDTDENESETSDDCDDTNADIFPGAGDIPDDGIDQNCDGQDSMVCFVDEDGDGFGTTETLIPDDMDCSDSGESLFDTDCDDGDSAIFPDAAEITDDGIDQDCNGSDTVTCFVDTDMDGLGDLSATVVLADDGSCDADEGEAEVADDCQETDPNTYPGAPELCDGNDNACTGAVGADEMDGDADGYVACSGWDDTQGDQPAILGGGDCAATDPLIAPGIAGNEAFVNACMKDYDGDGYGDVNPPVGVTAGTDCDDDSGSAASTFPGAAEIDGPFNCMKDSDDDGYGDKNVSLPVVKGTDCNDSNNSTNPGATELCDGNDTTCSGSVPANEQDSDGDLYVACTNWDDSQGDDPEILGGGDCAPADGSSFPGAAANEAVSGACMRDADGDDFGDQFPANPAVTAGTDCDDSSGTAAATFPGAAPADNATSCMKDSDGDDHGDDSVSLPVVAGTDCDDTDPLTFLGAAELPGDGIDQDCDGFDALTCFVDLDGDGFGSSDTVAPGDMDCEDPGESPFGTDCDDGNDLIFPGATEVPDDGIDQDCSGSDATVCFVDLDRDGSGGLAGNTVLAEDGSCDAVDGESDSTDDCDDTDPATYPGAPQICDGNDNTCGGVVPADEQDADGDGYVACGGWSDGQGDQPGIVGGNDCDESAADTFPGAASNDSSGACMKDADGDNFGDATPPGGVLAGTDCDDDSPTSASTFPGAAGNEAAGSACMKDLDGDNFGDASPIAGVVPGTDCDDTAGASDTYPGAPELCDGNDNACAGAVPDNEQDADGDGYVACNGWDDRQGDNPAILGGSDCDPFDDDTYPGAAHNENQPSACMSDQDGDGFGDADASPPITPGTDCDDTSATAFPGATEIADDGIDQDCNGSDTVSCIRDADQDGFGTLLGTKVRASDGTCDRAQGESDTADDCNDAVSSIYPGAPEVPNDGIDQDCDGQDSALCFVDADGDGFGGTDTLMPDDMDCTDPGESSVDTDCDDGNAAIFPGGPEQSDDGIDQDCNGFDTITCFLDSDGDGAGDPSAANVLADDGSCDAEQNESTTIDDCDASDPDTYPGAPELCDGNANSCGASVPVNELDSDGDFFVSCLGWDDRQGDDPEILGGNDCNDADNLTYPGLAGNESFAGACMKDHDGDGWGDLDPPAGVTAGTDCDDDSVSAAETFPGAAAIDGPLNCMKDSDGDDYGDASVSLPVVAGSDCDDSDPDINPGAAELCDGNNNACSGGIPANEQDLDGDLYVECSGWDDVQGDQPGILGGDDCDDADGDTFPGAAPNEATPESCMADRDGDDFGDAGAAPPVVAGTDCDDADSVTFPGATEICDGNDNDCTDGAPADEADLDGDLYVECSGWGDPQGDDPTILGGGDCDSGDGNTFPGAAPNEAASSACMRDADGDDFGDATAVGPVTAGTDCDDADSASFPGAAEACDGNDNDCTGGVPADETDDDGDLFVECTGWIDSQGDNASILGGDDCDDADATSYPGAAEACDGNDNACSGGVPADEIDNDGDLYVECAGWADSQGDDLTILGGDDCDDLEVTTYPGAPETCGDLIDSDCDGLDPACPEAAALDLAWNNATTLAWTEPQESVGVFTVYRGDLGVLRTTGVYTQEPANSAEAERSCGLTSTTLSDSFVPARGKSLFYLITAQTVSGESALGFSSDGQPRLNENPCTEENENATSWTSEFGRKKKAPGSNQTP